MASQLQLRGGTTAEHGSFTGAIRELTVDTTLKALRLHDGVTAGGTVIAGGVCMKPDTIDHVAAYSKEPTVRFPATYTKAENEFVMEMIAAGRIDPTPMVSHRVTLDELPEAFEALRTPTDQCKVIVTP